MKKIIFVLCFAWASGAFGGVDWRTMAKSCALQAIDTEVVECLRNGVKEQEQKEQIENDNKTAAIKEEFDRPVRLLVRDTSASISSFRSSGIGEKGASLSMLKDKGEDSTQAKIALFGILKSSFEGRVQPFFGASWSRDGSTRKDVRQLTLGTTGPLLQSDGPGDSSFTVIHTVQISKRFDLYGATDGTVARAHFDLAWAPLASGALLDGLAVLPHVAGLWQRRTDGGVEIGTWRSAYIGVQLEKPFELGTQRFKISALARRLFDTSVPMGNAERRINYFNLSLDYYFYDPGNKSAPLQPSLFITRETGTDFLEYGKPINRTTAGFRLKFN